MIRPCQIDSQDVIWNAGRVCDSVGETWPVGARTNDDGCETAKSGLGKIGME